MIEIKTVGYEYDDLQERAALLAKQLHYRLEKDAATCLFVTKEKLTLKAKGFSPLSADFTAASWYKRKAAGKKQGLIRACKPSKGLSIIDASAGWGRDAAILSSFGAKVLMLERHPLISVLVQDALTRQSEEDRQYMDLTLIEADARQYLKALEPAQHPDVVYIDPMHPQRSKAALVKKEMQALQQLIGTDEDALELIQAAILSSKQRVVVKWPQKLKPLLEPNLSIPGNTVRFDVYLISQIRSK